MAKTEEKNHIPDDIKRISMRLKSIRKGLNFVNSNKFALHYEIDRAQYDKYETGSQDFRINSLIKVLNKIDFSLSEFVNEEFDKIRV